MFGFFKNRIAISPLRTPIKATPSHSTQDAAGDFLIRFGELGVSSYQARQDSFLWNGLSYAQVPSRTSSGSEIATHYYIGTIGSNKYFLGYKNGVSGVNAYFWRWDGISQTLEELPFSFTTLTTANFTNLEKVRIVGTNIFAECGSPAKLYKLDTVSLTQTIFTNPAYSGNHSIQMKYVLNGKVYYTAIVNASNHRKFFVTDGTTATQLFETFVGGNDSPNFVAGIIGDRIYYNSQIALNVYKNYYVNTLTDTVVRLPDTSSVSTTDTPQQAKIALGKYFFSALNPSGLRKAYCWDGSSLTTLDFNIGGNDSPFGFTEFSGNVYFGVTINSSSHTKVAYWNGTTSGFLPQINVGASDVIFSLAASNKGVYYRASLGAQTKLFFWNGLVNTQLASSNPSGNDDPLTVSALGSDGDIYYYFSNLSSGLSQIFKADGAVSTQVSNLAYSVNSSHTYNLVPGVGFYAAVSNGSTVEIYKYNGTTFTRSPEPFNYSEPLDTTLTSSAYVKSSTKDLILFSTFKSWSPNFSARVTYTWDGTNLVELDSPALVNFRIANVASGGAYYPTDRNASDPYIFFYTNTLQGSGSGSTSNGRLRLIMFDGMDFYPIPAINISSSDAISDMSLIGTRLYFTHTVSTITKTYYYDTVAKTVTKLPDIRVGQSDVVTQNMTYVGFQGKVLYCGLDSSGLRRLMSYDPVANTITPISNIRVDGDNVTGNNNGVVGSSFYFFAADTTGTSNRKLFRYDGTTITQVTNNRPGNNDISSTNGTPRAGTFIFQAFNSSGFLKMYQATGGTVVQIPEIVVGGSDTVTTPSTTAGTALSVGSDFYYRGGLSASQKLYKWDGTSRTQVSNTFSGGSDSPGNLFADSSVIYFTSQISSGVNKTFKWDGVTVSQVMPTNPSGDEAGDFRGFVSLGDRGIVFRAKNSSGAVKTFFWDRVEAPLELYIPPENLFNGTSDYLNPIKYLNNSVIAIGGLTIQSLWVIK